MLRTFFKDGTSGTWHVGEQTHLELLKDDAEFRGKTLQQRFEDISYIEADGDELELIRLQYWQDGVGAYFGTYTIPMPRDSTTLSGFKRIARWYGDLARTILMNI